MTRTPEEIIDHHAGALADGDLAGVISDYAEDARFITPDGVVAGRAALTEVFAGVLEQFPGFTLSVGTLVADDDTVLLEWTADAKAHDIIDGVDTFVMRDGLIQLQTARFTVRSKSDGADA
ncbi:nuclear transport factor 2 family protein [Qaidamihabitans albus]|uniref:nuclear transport factor 2 family protein n=1 Tax=Qaidamihabitans albus TaxID=2795733 RepID=UPI0018F19F39|nr:nuclear transport factor 2 family protein [Qaidamihabitans albus]